MNRRCTGDSCLVMAGARFASLELPVASILPNPHTSWSKLAKGHGRVRVARDIEVDWKEFNAENYLFTHCTIVSSVEVEENGYHIKPACSELINNNGNAWSNQVLLSTFKSFVGGENYLEHVQIPELSKGKLLDAVLRPVRYQAATGEEADVYYCDILVATNRKHASLVKDIEAGRLNTMSMGCLADYVQCSRCGSTLGDNEPNCNHIDRELLQPFVSEDGVSRVVAELCGRLIEKDGSMVGDPDSVKFIEASWVARPAFQGAVLNHYLTDVPKAAKMLAFSTAQLEDTVENMFRMRVADRTGMIVLRVAREELARRRRAEMAGRIAYDFS